MGVDDKTVASVRSDLAATAEIPQLEKMVGDDGKARKSKRQSRKARPALEDWDEDDDDDFDDDLVEDFDDASRDEPESDRARLRRERREDRELAAWGGSREKTAKFKHAIGLIKHGVDPNSEEVQKLFREASIAVIKNAAGGGVYHVFAHCTEAGERDWYLFILFLSKEWNWWPEYAAAHVEYLSQKQFTDPDEWLGEEGRRFRRWPGGNEPSDEFKRAWVTFKETNSGRSQAEINAEIEVIYKERGPASQAPQSKRKRRKRAEAAE